MRFVLLHYHIFKNAGSTIEDILAHTFFENFERFDTSDPDVLVTNPELLVFLDRNPSLRALSSHQIRYPLPEAPGYLFFDLCFLRDPFDRIRSIYDYFLEKPAPGDPLSDLARAMTLGDFLARAVEEFPYRINDVQVNILAGRSPDDPPAEQSDLDRALATMLETSFLGVVDLFQQSLTAGAHFLRPVFPRFDFTPPPANVSLGMRSTLEERVAALLDACTPEVRRQVIELNRLDTELVRQARNEVHRRFAMAQVAKSQGVVD